MDDETHHSRSSLVAVRVAIGEAAARASGRPSAADSIVATLLAGFAVEAIATTVLGKDLWQFKNGMNALEEKVGDPPLATRGQAESVWNARTSLQHKGQRLAPEQLQLMVDQARAFCNEVASRGLGVTLSDVKLADLVRLPCLREALGEVEAAIESNDKDSAVEWLGRAAGRLTEVARATYSEVVWQVGRQSGSHHVWNRARDAFRQLGLRDVERWIQELERGESRGAALEMVGLDPLTRVRLARLQVPLPYYPGGVETIYKTKDPIIAEASEIRWAAERLLALTLNFERSQPPIPPDSETWIPERSVQFLRTRDNEPS